MKNDTKENADITRRREAAIRAAANEQYGIKRKRARCHVKSNRFTGETDGWMVTFPSWPTLPLFIWKTDRGTYYWNDLVTGLGFGCGYGETKYINAVAGAARVLESMRHSKNHEGSYESVLAFVEKCRAGVLEKEGVAV
jgi:hypothetical protein